MQTVTLRPIEMRDWHRIHEWASTEAACRFQPWGPNSPADSEQFVADALVAWQQEPIRRRVWAAEADGPGLVGLSELAVTSAKHRQGEVGYAVHLDWWGKGYGEAIARALLQRGFGELGLHRSQPPAIPGTSLPIGYCRRLAWRMRALFVGLTCCATVGATPISMRSLSTHRQAALPHNRPATTRGR